MGDSVLASYFTLRLPEEVRKVISESQLNVIIEDISRISELLCGIPTKTGILFNKEITEAVEAQIFPLPTGKALRVWAESFFGNIPIDEHQKIITKFLKLDNRIKLASLEKRLLKLLSLLDALEGSAPDKGQSIPWFLGHYGFSVETVNLLYRDLTEPSDGGSTARRDLMLTIFSTLLYCCFTQCQSNDEEQEYSQPDNITISSSEFAKIMERLSQLEISLANQQAPLPGLRSGFTRPNIPTSVPPVPKMDGDSTDSSSDEEDSASESPKQPKGKSKPFNLQEFLAGVPTGALPTKSSTSSSGFGSGFGSSNPTSYKFSPTMVKSASSLGGASAWWETPILGNLLIGLKDMYKIHGSELNPGDFYRMLNDDPFGVVLISLDGTPYSFTCEKAKSKKNITYGAPVCKLLNPECHPGLLAKASNSLIKDLYPTTASILSRLLTSLIAQCHKPSVIPFTQRSIEEKVELLGQFQRLFTGLIQRVGLHENGGQQNPFHITTMSLVLVFFLNRWMRSIVNQDLRLLVADFDSTWNAHYEELRKAYGSFGIPRIKLSLALFLLKYVCNKCGYIGSVMDVCSVPCGFDGSKGSTSNQQSRGAVRLTPDAYEKYKAWKSADKKARRNIGPSAYVTQQKITDGVIRDPISNTSAHSGHHLSDLYDRNAKDQSKISLHSYSYEI